MFLVIHMVMKNIKSYVQVLSESINPAQDTINHVLRLSAAEGNIQKMLKCIDGGADVDSRDAVGQTALHHAARAGKLKAATILVNSGASIDPINDLGLTPLNNAASSGKPEIIKLLLKAGADINKTNPLYGAADNRRLSAVVLLLKLGADPNRPNPDVGFYAAGSFPIQAAKRGAAKEIVRVLIEGGANPFNAFKDGAEILDYFNGDISWMPEETRSKIERTMRGRSAFGM